MEKQPKFQALKRSIVEKRKHKDAGFGNLIPLGKMPERIAKKVTAAKCDVDGQPLPPGTAVCFRCGNCVFCGAYNPDRYANTCLYCGNDAPGRTDDTDVVFTARVLH